MTPSPDDWDLRVQELLDVIFTFASGDLSARGHVSEDDSAFDVVMAGINILGEEIEAMLAENRRVTDSLRAASLYTRSLIEASLDPLFAIGFNGVITDVNGAACHATGAPRAELVGSDFAVHFVDPEGATAAYRSAFEDRSVINRPLVLLGRAGGSTEVLFNASVYENEAGEVAGVLAVARDISDRRRAERAEEIASRDGLTNLHNHRTFLSLLAEEASRADRFRRPVSVLMFDIDHFKRINDEYGHLAGDQVLQTLGALLARQVRSIDRVCRYGGDEFAVILPETTAALATSMAERIRQAVALESFDIGGTTPVSLTISIGIATYPAQASTIQELVKSADLALYRSKFAGRNRSTVYSSDLAGDGPGLVT